MSNGDEIVWEYDASRGLGIFGVPQRNITRTEAEFLATQGITEERVFSTGIYKPASPANTVVEQAVESEVPQTVSVAPEPVTPEQVTESEPTTPEEVPPQEELTPEKVIEPDTTPFVWSVVNEQTQETHTVPAEETPAEETTETPDTETHEEVG